MARFGDNARSMSRTVRRAALALIPVATLLAGCGANDDRPAKWSYISAAIIEPSCATANCHSQLAQRSGVVLDGIRVGYAQLLCRHFVLAGNADSSAVIALMNAQGARRMPPDFALPATDIKLIGEWINAGAPYDGPSPVVDPVAISGPTSCVSTLGVSATP
jgi:hypothetical protein